VWAECRVCTSQETQYVSTTKPNRLMLSGETVAVYCGNHTEHTDTRCGQNVEIIPHRKHITTPLLIQTGQSCLGALSLFILRSIRNTQIHCVCRMQRLYLTGNTIRLQYKFKPVNVFWERVAVYCENHTEHTDKLCMQDVELLPQGKNITSPLQRPTG
jgi:hypothetical protein